MPISAFLLRVYAWAGSPCLSTTKLRPRIALWLYFTIGIFLSLALYATVARGDLEGFATSCSLDCMSRIFYSCPVVFAVHFKGRSAGNWNKSSVKISRNVRWLLWFYRFCFMGWYQGFCVWRPGCGEGNHGGETCQLVGT